MDTRDLFPHEILQDAIGKSCAKSEFSIKMLVILSFLGGGYVGFGYLACLRVISGIPAEWNGLAALLGASVFPIALICILIGGGELATGNMMINGFGQIDRPSQHPQTGAQLADCQLGQSGRRRSHGLFPRPLRRPCRRTGHSENHCHCRSQSQYGLRPRIRFCHRM